MLTAREQQLRLLLRARDRVDRSYRSRLDIAGLAAIACMSPAHFIRSFKAGFGETPHRYLQRRRIERAMEQLRRTDRPVADICADVGWASFATFSRTFREVVGCSPSEYRRRPPVTGDGAVPTCFVKAWTRPAALPPTNRTGRRPDTRPLATRSSSSGTARRDDAA